MAIYKDNEGKEVEAFTPEEVEAQKQAALADFQAKNPDKSAELTTVQAELQKAKDDLEAALKGDDKDKDGNIRNLRVAAKAAEDKVKELETKFSTEIETIKNSTVNEYKSELLATFSNGDDKLKEKIEFFYKQFAGDAKTKQEVEDRMKNSMKLATDKPLPSFLSGVGSAGDRGNGGMPRAGDVNETDNAKLMRGVFGISDEVAKKYAPENYKPGN